jgi:hypothetical protein
MFDAHVFRPRTLFAITVLTFAVGNLSLRAAPPSAPNLTATVNGLSVTLSWTASANSPTFYMLQAGLAPGQTFVQARVDAPQTSITASAGPGTYFVRAIAFNNEGPSAPSNEVSFTLSAGCNPPSPPLNFRAMMRGTEAYLFWRRPASGPTTHYTVQAGGVPGETILQAPTPATGINAVVNSGTYYARVAAVNGCGTSPVSNEIQVPFPSASGRVSDPEPNTLLGLPDIQQLLVRIHNENPGLLAQSCPNPNSKYMNNPWLDRMVDRLRQYDTRFGYNKKPTRGPADNGGLPVIAAGDEITYFAGSGPAEGSRDIFVIDILFAHCSTDPGNPPSLTYRDFTGQEDAIWTSLGRFSDQ